jgi:hypothetical protein
MKSRQPDKIERTYEIYIDRSFKGVQFKGSGAAYGFSAPAPAAGAIDQYVDGPECIHGELNTPLNLIGFGYVHQYESRPVTQIFTNGAAVFFVHIHYHHIGSFGVKHSHGSLAQTTRASGYDGCFAAYFHGSFLLQV